MSTECSILCVGPFDPSIIDCLDYPPDWYENVKTGTRVISERFRVTTKSSSKELAEAVGAVVHDFNTHPIRNIEQIDVKRLRLMEDFTCNEGETDKLLRLWETKFTLTLMVNT